MKNIVNQFLAFETKHDLLNQQIDGVNFWRLIRFDLFISLLIDKGVYEAGMPSTQGRKHRIKSILRNIKGALLCPKQKQTKYIIAPHSRMNKGRDIYTHALIQYLGDDAHLIYEQSLPNMYAGAKTFGLASIQFQIRQKFYKLDESKIREIEGLFQSEFKTEIPLQKRITQQILKFKIYYNAYRDYFEKTRPEKVFIVVHYAHFAMISAAQDLGIQTLEIQHGTISDNHMGYAFPHCETPPYMPDILLCHGDYWTAKPPLPQQLKTHVIGAPHISGLGDTQNKKENTVLIFSQGTIARDLFPFVCQAAKLAPDYHFIYRLHPSERIGDYNVIKDECPDNMRLTNNNDDFLTELSTSEFIASVYSTTLYEAMALGAKAIVIGLNGHNAVQGIIDNGDAPRSKTPNEFATALKTAKPCADKDKYYKPFTVENYKDALK